MQAVGNEVAVHEGEGVVGQPRVQSGHQGAREDHGKDIGRERPRRGSETPRTCGDGMAPLIQPQVQRQPPEQTQDQDRETQVRGQFHGADHGLVDKAALHHDPAHRALCAAQHEQPAQLQRQRAANGAPDQKHDERHREGDPYDASPQAVEVLQPEDSLERLQAHAGVLQQVLRRLTIGVESGLPLRLVERWQDGEDLPLNHGQAGVRKPCRCAETRHEHHHAAQDKQPDRNGPASARGRGAGCGSAPGRAVWDGNGRRR